MGPTIPGIKQILFWPETEMQIGYLRAEENKVVFLRKHLGHATI